MGMGVGAIQARRGHDPSGAQSRSEQNAGTILASANVVQAGSECNLRATRERPRQGARRS